MIRKPDTIIWATIDLYIERCVIKIRLHRKTLLDYSSRKMSGVKKINKTTRASRSMMDREQAKYSHMENANFVASSCDDTHHIGAIFRGALLFTSTMPYS